MTSFFLSSGLREHKMRGISLILLTLLLSTALVSNASAGWWNAFGQFFDMEDDISFWDVLELYLDGVAGGLSTHESFDRVGTVLYCPEEYPLYCEKDKGNFVLKRYEWAEDCRGYAEDCCVVSQVNCRDVLVKGEKAAHYDIKLRDMRALCIHNNCGQLDFCRKDSQCGSFICPDVIGGPDTPKCDPDLLRCYCAGFCGDDFCDWREKLDRSCPEDCALETDDSDTDGLSDWDEVNLYGTDPYLPDTDGDGMEDGMEIAKGSDPLDPDSDDGGQCDGSLGIWGVCRRGPDPCPLDSNNLCFVAIPLRRSIYSHDSDSDGLINALDPCPLNHTNICAQGNDPPMVLTLGSEPAGDEDGNGVDDLWELRYGIEDPQNDPDADGLTNLEEYRLGTDPLSLDSDSDGMPDAWETRYGDMEPDADDDGDGLTNLEEYYADTDPTNPDSDGDGILDGDEGLIPHGVSVNVKLKAIYPEDEDPEDGVYHFGYGQTIQQVIVEAEYSDGMPLLRPALIGELTVKGGTETISFHFNRSSSNSYVAFMEYDILERNNEAPFMRLEVMALDPLGNSGSLTKRLFVMGQDTMPLELVEPQGGDAYAYGQWVNIEVIPRPNSVPESLSVRVFLEGSDEDFLLVRQGTSFVGDYQITQDGPDPLSLLIYARAEFGGESSESVRGVEVDIQPVLKATLLPSESTKDKHLFRITYPDGQPIPDKALLARVSGMDVEMRQMSEGVYVLSLASQEGKGISGEVMDSYGNKGKLAVPAARAPAGSDSSFLQLIVIAAVFAALLLLLRKVRAKRMEGKVEEHHKERVGKRKGQLKELIKATRNSFYKRQMTQEEAAKRISDYEAELKTLEMDEKAEI